MTPTPPPLEKLPAKTVKLEMIEEQLSMIVYMLGAINLQTDPETLRVALDLRKKLSNALKVFKPKNKPKLDKYGKVMTQEEIEKAQEVRFRPGQKLTLTRQHRQTLMRLN